MRKVLVIPKYLRKITANHISLNYNFEIFGCDTETCNGEPFFLQINNGKEIFMKYVNKVTILDEFLNYFDKKKEDLNKIKYYICFFHRLDFDLVALLYNQDLKLFRKTDFKLQHKDWLLECYTGKRYFSFFRKQNKVIALIDSFGYLPYRLKKVAKDLKIPFQKRSKPKGLGQKVLKSKDFIEYAKTDVLIEYEVGKWIMDLHKMYDTRLCVSLPQLAMRIFRHKFLKPNDVIQLPPDNVLKASLRSYHGGKNGMYVSAGIYKNCSEIDINSAYPYAMKMLPSFLEGEFKEVNYYEPKFVGIYNISGEVNCPYNIFFDDDFKAVKNKFSDIWVTCYEIAEALKHNEVKIDNIFGYIWIPKTERNPFADYVNYFYEKKNNTSKDNSLYTFYKLALNSLYGKLIQATKLDNEDTACDYETYINSKGELIVKRIQQTYQAGGLFNPFIATLITGKVRAMIHDLEHKFKAIHTATDSIKTLENISGCNNELGGYKLELTGTCYLFRNKCYLHYDKSGKLKKYALHGFQGKVEDLINLMKTKSNIYETEHLFKVKEALIQNKIPLNMEKIKREFNINWKNFKYNN
ncbi:MAG: DNA polymerase [Candidatus Aenigmatarchaeota archaeon]